MEKTSGNYDGETYWCLRCKQYISYTKGKLCPKCEKDKNEYLANQKENDNKKTQLFRRMKFLKSHSRKSIAPHIRGFDFFECKNCKENFNPNEAGNDSFCLNCMETTPEILKKTHVLFAIKNIGSSGIKKRKFVTFVKISPKYF